jgi:hypothetical protein
VPSPARRSSSSALDAGPTLPLTRPLTVPRSVRGAAVLPCSLSCHALLQHAAEHLPATRAATRVWRVPDTRQTRAPHVPGLVACSAGHALVRWQLHLARSGGDGRAPRRVHRSGRPSWPPCAERCAQWRALRPRGGDSLAHSRLGADQSPLRPPPRLLCSPSLAPHNRLQQLRLTKKVISAARHDRQVRELDWEDAEYGGLRGEVRSPPPTIPASGARARGTYGAGRRCSIGC